MKIALNNVRLAFPALFEPEDFQGDGKAKFKATFIITPDHPANAAIKKAMETAAKEKWKDKAAGVYKALKAADKLCIHDGDSKPDYDGFPGNFYLSASNQIRPLVLDGNKTPLTATDGKPYSA